MKTKYLDLSITNALESPNTYSYTIVGIRLLQWQWTWTFPHYEMDKPVAWYSRSWEFLRRNAIPIGALGAIAAVLTLIL